MGGVVIGITTNAIMYQYPDADLDETLRMLGKDFRLIEIDGNRFVLSDKQLISFARAGKNYGVRYTIHAPVFGVNLASHETEARKKSVEIVKHYIDGARKLNAPSVNVHAGNIMLDMDPFLQEKVGGRKMFISNARQSLEELVDFGKESGVHVTVENMFGPFAIGLNVDEMKELLKSGAGFCFDCGHAYLSRSLDDFLDKLPSPDYMHLCDSNTRMDHLAVGEGDINFRNVLRRLKLKKDNIVMEIISTHDKVRKSKDSIESLMR